MMQSFTLKMRRSSADVFLQQKCEHGRKGGMSCNTQYCWKMVWIFFAYCTSCARKCTK
uniref:Uncharacterized protein n=1 Tax=Anguilla anguilla TaxID=7936 RepID=A0A0E9X2Z5_ANGAN